MTLYSYMRYMAAKILLVISGTPAELKRDRTMNAKWRHLRSAGSTVCFIMAAWRHTKKKHGRMGPTLCYLEPQGILAARNQGPETIHSMEFWTWFKMALKVDPLGSEAYSNLLPAMLCRIELVTVSKDSVCDWHARSWHARSLRPSRSQDRQSEYPNSKHQPRTFLYMAVSRNGMSFCSCHTWNKSPSIGGLY